jgi:hypothetical protein
VTTLVERDGGIVETVDRDAIRERLDAGEFFWLDLVEPTADEYSTLREVFDFHPLAIEDSVKFGQRASSRTTAPSRPSSSSAGRRTRTVSSRCTASTQTGTS